MATDDKDDMTFFDGLIDSPVKADDDNSVDIYDGLDSVQYVSGNTPKQSTPSRDLDLYEELLTEEGAAKESSFKNLHEQYEKCQRQLKDLIHKLKELQTQNSGLQTENQCLKKNISALIKTARVEITRKDEQINKLSQRMTGFPTVRSNHNRNHVQSYIHAKPYNVSKTKDLKSRETDHSPKTDIRQQATLSKDVHHTNLVQNGEKSTASDHEKDSTLQLTKISHQKLCVDRVHSCLATENCSSEDGKRGRQATKVVAGNSGENVGKQKRDEKCIEKRTDCNLRLEYCKALVPGSIDTAGPRSENLEINSFNPCDNLEDPTHGKLNESKERSRAQGGFYQEERLAKISDYSDAVNKKDHQALKELKMIKPRDKPSEKEVQKLDSRFKPLEKEAKISETPDKSSEKERRSETIEKTNEKEVKMSEPMDTPNEKESKKSAPSDKPIEKEDWCEAKDKPNEKDAKVCDPRDRQTKKEAEKCATSDKPTEKDDRCEAKDKPKEKDAKVCDPRDKPTKKEAKTSATSDKATEKEKRTCETKGKTNEKEAQKSEPKDYQTEREEKRSKSRDSAMEKVGESSKLKEKNSEKEVKKSEPRDKPTEKEPKKYEHKDKRTEKEVRKSEQKEKRLEKEKIYGSRDKPIEKEARKNEYKDKTAKSEFKTSQTTDKPTEKEVKIFEHQDKPIEKEQEEPRRSSRVNSLHSRSDPKTPDQFTKCLANDSRNWKAEEHRSKRRSLNYSSKDGKSHSTCSRENRHTSPKQSGNKHERKSEKHKSEDKNKKHKETREETRHSRSERKETSDNLQNRQETEQPPEKEKGKSGKGFINSQTTALGSPVIEVCDTLHSPQNVENMCRDPKLSFMEKLNLTLSPTKRKSIAEIEELQAVLHKARKEGATRAQKLPVPMVDVTDSKEQTECTVQPVSIEKRILEKEVPNGASSSRIKSLEKGVVCTWPLKSSVKNTDDIVLATEMDKNGTDLHTSNVLQEAHCLITAIDDDLETVSSEELDSRSMVDDTGGSKLGSSMESDLWNGCTDRETSDNSSGVQTVFKTVCEAGMLKSKPHSANVAVNIASLKPSLTESEINIVTSLGENVNSLQTGKSETIPASEDESSVLSVDLNHLRNIPQVISPLTSPIRPVVKIHRLESSAMASVVRSLNKDLSLDLPAIPVSSKTLSELNKENQNPVWLPEKAESTSGLLEELEEGEILSSDDNEEKKPSTESSANNNAGRRTSKRKDSSDEHTSVKHQQDLKKRRTQTHPIEKSAKMTSPKSPARKTRANIAPRDISLTPKEMGSAKMVLSHDTGEVKKLTVPFTVREVMQMLRIIRNDIRKKYMKFKVQFSLRQFHGFIETSVVHFTLFLKDVDWSRMCSSSECLIQKLSKTIEFRLGNVKSNGIVDRIFGQHVLDMKKKLWKFVDDQLDYLFEKIKVLLVKLCDLAKGDSGSEDCFPILQQKRSITYMGDILKATTKVYKTKSQNGEESSAPKIRDLQSEKCQRVIPLFQNSKKQDASKSTFKTDRPLLNRIEESATNLSQCEKDNSPSSSDKALDTRYEKEAAFKKERSAHKFDVTSELLRDQQTSSLTYDLVSDAHMGEIFRRLLKDQNLIEENTSSLEKSELEPVASEKTSAVNVQNVICVPVAADTVQEEAFLQSGTPDGSSSPVTPLKKSPSLSSMLKMPVHPDILDESCMLEIPTFSYANKDNASFEERDKSYISLLAEDLAVSLTVPSPLKSDGHLSFLQTGTAPTPEEVINAHYSEDALLDEEDATEQDIHLALESDNSSSHSSCSSSWANRAVPPGFQYHPKQPMQAVIMEKSNDHFIVKIRRALPAASADDEISLTDAESLNSTATLRAFQSKTCSPKQNSADEHLLKELVSLPPELEGSSAMSSQLARQTPPNLEAGGLPHKLQEEARCSKHLPDKAASHSAAFELATERAFPASLELTSVICKMPVPGLAKSSPTPPEPLGSASTHSLPPSPLPLGPYLIQSSVDPLEVFHTKPAPPVPSEPYPIQPDNRPPEPLDPYPTQPCTTSPETVGGPASLKAPAQCQAKTSCHSPEHCDPCPTQFHCTTPEAFKPIPASTTPCLSESSTKPPKAAVAAPGPTGPCTAQSTPNPKEPPKPTPALQRPFPRRSKSSNVSIQPSGPCRAQSRHTRPDSNISSPVPSKTTGLVCGSPNTSRLRFLLPGLSTPASLETSGESSEPESSCSGNTTESSSDLIFVNELEAPEVVVETYNNATDVPSSNTACFQSSNPQTSVSSTETSFVDLTEETDDESKQNHGHSQTKSATKSVSLDCGTVGFANLSNKRKKATTAGVCPKKSKPSPELVIETKRQRRRSRKAEESEFFVKGKSSSKKASPEKMDLQAGSSSTSPQNLYAKNVVKKKGEVVVAWTRDDDREILLQCQKQGPTEEAFASLSKKLKKDSDQVSQRFQLLMKLFKKSANTSS
ncbi:CASP8-associated protein 2 [Ambystoma mexicanum]|uniref:CASP8-associated protein 2 n=1 Tax=Ambystoma mexicanum TaxID=8296 RepID=UPI0037E725EC